MNILKKHLLTLFEKGNREEERGFSEYRNISIEYGVSAKSAEGSARVFIGGTEVIAGVKLDVGTPFPDNPDEGTIIVSAELLPLASNEFESGPPGIHAIELSRVVDRGIRESGALDLKKLCIKKGEKVWLIYVDIYPINDGGNLFDAASLAALAALKDAKFPDFDGEKINYEKRTNNSLPMKTFPISCTVRKLGNKLFVDPTWNEDFFSDSRLTVAVNKDGNICALQKGGDSSFSFSEIDEALELAVKSSNILRKELEKK